MQGNEENRHLCGSRKQVIPFKQLSRRLVFHHSLVSDSDIIIIIIIITTKDATSTQNQPLV